jgi:4-amino-4-deoxy-L-arabinose transferase-like glycosyltransferase
MHGVYGDDLFTGYYGMERHTYNFPPLFPLTEALAFRLLGVGAWQARLVAVLFGAATLALTYALGRRLYDAALGALAAWLLIGLRLALEPQASGVPLIDQARNARYDIAVPPLVLATLLCFLWADRAGDCTIEHGRVRTSIFDPRSTTLRYLAAGLLAGLAFLAHVYGGFVLALLGALLLWRDGWAALRRPALYLIAAGFVLALLPWALYIAQDLAAYSGQMLPERARFDVWSPTFYLNSLLQEPSRYRHWLRQDGVMVLWPRLGIWLALLGLPAAHVLLLRRAGAGRTPSPLAERMLLLALPILALLLALLVNLKFYNYVVILLPFIALDLALLLWLGWRAANAWTGPARFAGRLALGGLIALTLLEGMAGVWHSLRSAAAASSYAGYTSRIASAIPPRSRVLALHQFWFGLYSQGYVYRSLSLVFYLSDPRYYPPAPLPMEVALDRIAPEYILVDRAMAPELRMELPIAAIADEQRRGFRHYMAEHCARLVAQIADPDYGDLAIYQLCSQPGG